MPNQIKSSHCFFLWLPAIIGFIIQYLFICIKKLEQGSDKMLLYIVLSILVDIPRFPIVLISEKVKETDWS